MISNRRTWRLGNIQANVLDQGPEDADIRTVKVAPAPS